MAEDKVEAAGGGGGAAKWGAGALLGALVAGGVWYFGFRPTPEAPPDASAPAAMTAPTPEPPAAATAEATVPDAASATGSSPAAKPSTESAGGTEAARPTGAEVPAAGASSNPTAPDTPAATAPLAPNFDTVRVDADGSVLVAGRAMPDAALSLYLDSSEVAQATASGDGSFATLFTIPPSDAPRTLSLVGVMPDGTRVSSEQTVIIAPFAAAAPPEVVAEATGQTAASAASSVPDSQEPAPAAPAAPATSQPATPEGTQTATALAVEPAGPEVLIADPSGVRKQTVAGSISAIVIDTIGYGASGEVRIEGRGTAGNFARIYLDNEAKVTADIAKTGLWSIVLEGIAPGIYTLRVDQLDAGGKVTSRFETPFKRETPETVAAAMAPEAPQTGATALAAVPGTEAGQTASATAVQQGDQAAQGFGASLATREAPPSAVRAGIVTVQPGFTLWRIARENYGDGILYVKVFEANKDQIRNPDLIYPGQIFNVPAP